MGGIHSRPCIKLFTAERDEVVACLHVEMAKQVLAYTSAGDMLQLAAASRENSKRFAIAETSQEGAWTALLRKCERCVFLCAPTTGA